MLRNWHDGATGIAAPHSLRRECQGLYAMLDEQIRWVLRNARIHAADPEMRTASGFAGGAGRAPSVHRSQVGRWESGGAEISHDLVRRYEIVLGLPEGQLLCAIDHLSRDRQPIRWAPTLQPRQAPDFGETLSLVERALSTERMTGLDWDRLSGNLGRMPQALLRSEDWERMIRRCILELTMAENLEYAQREEAVARLAGHPRSGAVVVEMARAMLGDQSTAVYNDVTSLLNFCAHPKVVPLLLGHLEHPTNNDSLRAALFVLTMVVHAGRVDQAALGAGARLALSHIRDTSRPFYVHRAAANLLRVLELPERRRLATVLTADDRRHVATILMEGRALGLEAVNAMRRRLTAALSESLGPADQRDSVLQDLLMTILGTTEEAARSNALAVLMLAPQRRPVGLAYAAELRRARECGDDVAAIESLGVLSWLVEPESVGYLTEIVLDPVTSADRAMLAAIALGNAGEPDPADRQARDEALRARALAIVTGSARWGEPSRAGWSDPEQVRQQLRGMAYALAMRGRFDYIAELRTELRPTDPFAEVSAGVLTWWLDLPEYVRPA